MWKPTGSRGWQVSKGISHFHAHLSASGVQLCQEQNCWTFNCWPIHCVLGITTLGHLSLFIASHTDNKSTGWGLSRILLHLLNIEQLKDRHDDRRTRPITLSPAHACGGIITIYYCVTNAREMMKTRVWTSHSEVGTKHTFSIKDQVAVKPSSILLGWLWFYLNGKRYHKYELQYCTHSRSFPISNICTVL